MPVFLEIARAACLSLTRRLGLWLLGLAVLAVIGWFADIEVTRALVTIGLLALVGAAVPVVVGTGLRRWLRAGPLGLASRGAGYWATFGYGVGAAAVALPFVLLAVRALDGRLIPYDEATAAFTLFIGAWLGASAGRLVEGGLAVAMLTWIGAAVVGASAFLVAFAARDLTIATLAPVIGNRFAEGVLMGGSSIIATHVLMLGAAYADQRAPTTREL